MISRDESIGSDYYDSSGYYETNATHLHDFDSPFQQYRVKKLKDIYDPQPSETVIDFGCGWGTFCWAFSNQVHHITGIDFSETSIRLCNAHLKKQRYDNVVFLLNDVRKVSLTSEAYDLILAADLFEHLYLKDTKKVIREAYRLLKRKGHLSIWTPSRSHIIEILKNRNILLKKDETHVDYKSKKELIEMLESAGFIIKKHYYAESHIPVFSFLEKIFMRILPIFRRRIAILAYKP